MTQRLFEQLGGFATQLERAAPAVEMAEIRSVPLSAAQSAQRPPRRHRLAIAAAIVILTAGLGAIAINRSQPPDGTDTIVQASLPNSDTEPAGPTTLCPDCKTLPDGVVAHLEAPAIGLMVEVGSDNGDSALKIRPGLMPASDPISPEGTVIIWGHRTTYGQEFRRLDELREGDTITLTTASEQFTYIVDRTEVTPHDTALPVTDTGTLILTANHPKWSQMLEIRAIATIDDMPEGFVPPRESPDDQRDPIQRFLLVPADLKKQTDWTDDAMNRAVVECMAAQGIQYETSRWQTDGFDPSSEEDQKAAAALNGDGGCEEVANRQTHLLPDGRAEFAKLDRTIRSDPRAVEVSAAVQDCLDRNGASEEVGIPEQCAEVAELSNEVFGELMEEYAPAWIFEHRETLESLRDRIAGLIERSD